MSFRQAVVYRSETGAEPYSEYLAELQDRSGVGKIKIRIARAERGNLGDHRAVGEGVVELRIHFGPGYRVYVGFHGAELIVLLCAGDKSSQGRDIRRAIEYWREYRRRK